MTPKEKEDQKTFVREVMNRTGLTAEQLAERIGRKVPTFKKILWADIRLTESIREALQNIADHYTKGAVAFGADGTPRGRLAAALQARRMSPQQLAKLIRYDAGIITNVINGSGRASEKMIEAIVRELPELTKEDLMGGSDSAPVLSESGVEGTYGAKAPVTLPPGMKGFMVPLLSMAQAGGWDAGHSDEGWSGDAIFAMNVDDRRAFAIRVSGNSMEPEIKEGDLVICSPRERVTNGCCAVVRTKSEQAFIKFWKQHGNAVTLESANPDYRPIQFPLAEIAGAWPVVQRIASGKITKG